MKKIIAIMMTGLLLVGCGSGNSADGDKAKTTINIPTAATTGALYPLGSSIATLWNEKVPNIRANAQASNGGIENLNLLQQGEAQVSFAVVSNVYQSYHGEEKFEGRANEKLRIIAGLYYNPNQVVVSKNSGIESFDQIAGKSFATGAPGSTTEDESKLHLTAAGIAYPDGIKAQFIGFTEAIDLMRNKQLDGAWIMAGIPTAAVTEMTTTADGRLVAIPDDIIAKLQANYPWYAKYLIPANTYSGQSEEVQTTAIKMAMFTTADLSEEVVYELTKAFWKNIQLLQESNASLKSVSVENAITDLAEIPLHDGAIKYYKEIGLLK